MDDPGPHLIPKLSREQLDALVETMYLVAFADGEYAAAEREHFERSVEALTHGRVKGTAFDSIIEHVAEALANDGRDRCVAAVKERLGDVQLRQVALILAMDMAAADGKLHPAERSVLLALADAFDIPPDSAREVIDGPAELSVEPHSTISATVEAALHE